MAIVPGTSPGPREEDPLPAGKPPPPGQEDLTETVERIDQAVRQGGSSEVEQADREADAVESDATGGSSAAGPGASSDADEDPTSDQGADPEDPEAQDGEGGRTSDTD